MLEIEQLTVTIDGVDIIEDVDLDVRDGEVVSVLGPSGSGKSTLLRAVAGLVPVTRGDIRWNGRSVLEIPTHERGFGLMFQGFALFPHMDVAGNVAFGLRMAGRRSPGDRVGQVLSLVNMEGFGQRDVGSLSGGERQRVALARTLAPEPALVMLDEPLGALDRNLRKRLLSDLGEILSDPGVTALVVTHDREEAAALGDRLGLMREGRLVQAGPLSEILASPADDWVASFMG